MGKQKQRDKDSSHQHRQPQSVRRDREKAVLIKKSTLKERIIISAQMSKRLK